MGTDGGLFYVLDNIAVLLQLKPEIANENVHLFRPRPAVRSVNQAFIDYYLKQPADKVTVQILDGEGELVRSFEGSAEEEKKSKPAGDADPDAEFGGPPRVKPPTRGAALNRFTWDLRYPGAKTFEGMILLGGPAQHDPLAPPGEQHVRLIVNGETQTEKLRVFKDPRL